MALSGIFGGIRKWIALGIGLVLLAILGNAIFGPRIRLAAIADDLTERPEEAMEELRALGPDYRSTLEDAIRDGDYPLTSRYFLFQVALNRPYYLSEKLRSALESEDDGVRRGAVLAYLEWDIPRTDTRGPVADDVFGALSRWCGNAESNSTLLGVAIRRLKAYRDDRVPDLLLDLLRERSSGETLEEIGRANDARKVAAEVLAEYPDHPEVFPTLVEIVKRDSDDEASWVQTRAWEALARAGYAEDPEVYWIAARQGDDLTRQFVAANLENVKSERVIAILEFLLGDRREVVRRAALNSLAARRAPVVTEDARYIAEDHFSAIRGDVVEAIGMLRKKELVPFVAWCLNDTDPNVVEKSIVALFKLTGETWVFTPQMWEEFRGDWQKRHDLLDDVMNDLDRKALAIDRIAAKWGGRYTDEDRVPPLIRMLGHADPENVKRAMRLLAEITGRTEGFDPAILDPAAEVDAEADAMYRFMNEEGRSAEVIADWRAWWEENRPK